MNVDRITTVAATVVLSVSLAGERSVRATQPAGTGGEQDDSCLSLAGQ